MQDLVSAFVLRLTVVQVSHTAALKKNEGSVFKTVGGIHEAYNGIQVILIRWQ